MAITISGENNNDRILASDGVIDQISGINFSGIITASHINVGSNIQLGNAGIVTATTFVGNVTGNVNSTSPLLLQTGGSERFRITGNNELGIAGANYGSAGQVLTSGGSGSAVSWTTIPTQLTINHNADNRIITGSGTANTLEAESTLTFNANTLKINNKNLLSTSSIITYSPDDSVRYQMSVSNTDGVSLLSKNTTGSYNTYMIDAGSFRVRTTATNSPAERLRITSGGDINIHNRTAASTTDPVTVDFGGQYTPDASITHQNLKVKLFSNSSNNDAAGLTMAQSGNAYVSSVGAGHLFYTAPSAVDTLIERLRIAYDGVITGRGELRLTEGTTTVSDGSEIGSLMYTYPSNDNKNAKIVALSNGGSSGADLAFFTRVQGDGTNTDGGTEKLRIDSSGRVLIGNYTDDIGDGTLQVYSSDKKHPAIRTNSANANGYAMFSDAYMADESQVNIGISYSSAKLVLSTSVKVSDATDNTYLSSQDTFSARPCALTMNHQGVLTFLNTNTNATTTTDSAVTLYERLRITSDGRLLMGVTTSQQGDANLQVFRAATTSRITFGNINTSASGVTGIDFCPSNKVMGSRIECHATEDFSSTANRTADLVFITRKDGTFNEKLRITSDGNIGFNRDTVNAGDSESQTSTATPHRFVFDNNYSNNYTDGSLKLYLFNDGATRQGFTSGPLYDLQYHSSGHATHAKHTFYTQNVEKLKIEPSLITLNNEDIKLGTGTRTLYYQRNLAAAINSTTEIVRFQRGNGAHSMRVSIVVSSSGFSCSKVYEITSSYNQTSSAWRVVRPISSTGRYDANFELLYYTSNTITELKLRKVDFATYAGVADIAINYTGSTAHVTTVTSKTGTGTDTNSYDVLEEGFGLYDVNNGQTALTLPKFHPSFMVHPANDAQTADGFVTYTSVSYNNGGHYKTTGGNAGKFIAPVFGRYFFAANYVGAANCTNVFVRFYINGAVSNKGNHYSGGGNAWSGTPYMSADLSGTCVQLAKDDYVQLHLAGQNGGGQGQAAYMRYFGYLVG